MSVDIYSYLSQTNGNYTLSNTSPHTYLVTPGTGTHVQTTAPDGRVDVYTAEIISSQEYSAYGAELPGYCLALSDYRYSFNGQEKETEITGTASHTSAEFWMYDSRLGRRWEVDPIVKEYESSYAAFVNNPICFRDPNGADTVDVFSDKLNDKGEQLLVGDTPLFLFRVFTHDNFKGAMGSKEFLATYQTLSPNIEYVENSEESKVRIYAEFIYANDNYKLLSKSIYVTEPETFFKVCQEARNAVGGKGEGLNLLEKFDYFDHTEEYDYKFSYADEKTLVYIKNVGVFESDILGNMLYGFVAQQAGQDLFESFYDGDKLTKSWDIDNVYDSYALAFGAMVLANSPTGQTLAWGRNNFYLKKNAQYTEGMQQIEFRGESYITLFRNYNIGYYAQFGSWIRHGQYLMSKQKTP